MKVKFIGFNMRDEERIPEILNKLWGGRYPDLRLGQLTEGRGKKEKRLITSKEA